MMKKYFYFKVLCTIIVVIGLAANCALAQTATPMTALEKKLYEGARKEGKILYWDSLSLKEASQFIKAFNNRYPGIEVSYYETNSLHADEKYFAEHAAGKNPVDLVQIEWYEKYKKDGLLADLSDIIKDSNYPREFTTKDSDAISVEHTVRGVAYNNKLIPPKEAPRTWDDLLNPRWKGKIAVEISMTLFASITGPFGGEERMIAYLRKLKEQEPIFTDGITHTMTLLGAGEFPLAMNIQLSRVLVMQEKGSPVAWVPISPIVDRFAPYIVPRDAPHPNAARLYAYWLMSTEGQTMVDKVRMKGNPLPGSGTAQARALEQAGSKVVVVPQWELDFKRLSQVYGQAVGYTKGTKVR